MTLLLVELQRTNENFDADWTTWQTERGEAAPLTHRDIRLIHDHFPFVLYEYFPHVSLRAARSIALASRVASMYTLVMERRASGALPFDWAQAAGDWLHARTRAQLEQAVGESSSLLDRLAEACARCRESFERDRAEWSLPIQPVPFTHFQQTAADKTALAYLISAAFAALADALGSLPGLEESQRHLYASLYLFRGVRNWKQDYTAGAFSYPLIQLLASTPALTPADNEDGRQAQIQEVGRHFYYSGLAEHMLDVTAESLCRAMAAVTDLPPTPWGALAAGLLEQVEQLRKDIAQIRQKRVAEALARQHQPRPARLDASRPSPDRIAAAIDSATRYLIQQSARNGSWGDFMLLAEQSTFWVTGYVGWTLNTIRMRSNVLPRAAQWLIANQYPSGGWGYNSHWPEDADSTANALLFLSGCEEVDPARRAAAMNALLQYQRPDGGFTTIIDAEAWLSRFRSQADDLSGWTSSHPCVTTVVALLLATACDGRYRAQAEQAVDYLCARQHAEGYWDAYWWSGRFYTTGRAVQAMRALGLPDHDPHLARAAAWLTTSQSADGGWAAEEGANGQAFHTALAVQALCTPDSVDEQVVHRGANWLLDHQLADGSWTAVPILRVPAPHLLRPWEGTPWRESILGLNVVVPDWRRLFATATAIQALHAVAHLPPASAN